MYVPMYFFNKANLFAQKQDLGIISTLSPAATAGKIGSFQQ